MTRSLTIWVVVGLLSMLTSYVVRYSEQLMAYHQRGLHHCSKYEPQAPAGYHWTSQEQEISHE